MATYSELYNLGSTDSALRNKVMVACIIAAEAIRIEDGGTANHSNRLIWAVRTLADPNSETTRMLWSILAQNSGATASQITNATDATIQSAVNNAINIFATG